jgi:hypothetical protein
MVDPATWDLALSVLISAGHKEINARALVGRWLSDYEETDVVDALTKAMGKADPKSYAIKVLKCRKKKVRKVQDQLPLAPQTPPASRETIDAALARSKAILRGRSS